MLEEYRGRDKNANNLWRLTSSKRLRSAMKLKIVINNNNCQQQTIKYQ